MAQIYITAVYYRGYSIYVGLEHARYIVREQKNNEQAKWKENIPLNKVETK